ncbi:MULTISPECIES: LysR family transcriptional regulator [Thermomonosporaceae]|uniref:LysR family transcriptional regulator n=1 Tax=Thermomonosporaceae TaxID=2012 RepID=UPI00255AE4B4|nr:MULTISPECIES: LysR family transcriptional regulator [Thermomonosporaceae]MDL4774841.1 LysR family transcriptional regulator [Actinomadura xylanilytica]
MERHEIEVFLTLADELHFGRTAERLGLSQSRVSQTVQKLERRIGVLLFERTSRQVSLTPIGRQFHDDLFPAHELVRQAFARAVAAGRGITGTLRVGYSGAWCGDLIVAAGDLFNTRHPDCRIDIREVQITDPLGPLRAGELDLQISELPIDEPDIRTGPVVFSEPRALMVPDGHALARRESVSVEDLADAVLVTTAGTMPDYWLDHHFPRRTPAGRPIPQGPAVRYWQEVFSHVYTGKGVSPAALRTREHYSRAGVTWIPFSDAPPIEYGLLWRVASETALIRAFAQTIVEIADSGPTP